MLLLMFHHLLQRRRNREYGNYMVKTLIWSNPTFSRVDEAEETCDVGIHETTRQKDRSTFCHPTPSSLVFSFNLSPDRKGPASSEVARSNPRRSNSKNPDQINEDFPKSRSEVRNPGRMSEAEANIRAELAREIEKELELELEQQIAILTCRLQILRDQRKSQIPVNGFQSFSLQKTTLPQNHNKGVDGEKKMSSVRSGSGKNLAFKGFCSGVDVLTQSVASKKNNSSNIDCRDMKRDKQPCSVKKMKKITVSESFKMVDNGRKALPLFGARSFKAK